MTHYLIILGLPIAEGYCLFGKQILLQLYIYIPLDYLTAFKVSLGKIIFPYYFRVVQILDVKIVDTTIKN